MAAASALGANVSALARTHGLSPQRVFTWRRQAAGTSRKKVKGAAVRPSFAVVTLDGVRLRIGGEVDGRTLRVVLAALEHR